MGTCSRGVDPSHAGLQQVVVVAGGRLGGELADLSSSTPASRSARSTPPRIAYALPSVPVSLTLMWGYLCRS
jgi:hypothetical protein